MTLIEKSKKQGKRAKICLEEICYFAAIPLEFVILARIKICVNLVFPYDLFLLIFFSLVLLFFVLLLFPLFFVQNKFS